MSTATATGAAACRLALVARGVPVGHPTRNALGNVETGVMAAVGGALDVDSPPGHGTRLRARLPCR